MVYWWIAPLLFSLAIVGVTFLAGRDRHFGALLAFGVAVVGIQMAGLVWFVFFLIQLFTT